MIGIVTMAILAAAPVVAAPPDACALLTVREIRGVQAGMVRSRKPADRSQGGLAVSQCFFEVAPFASSVSLEVVRRGLSGGAGRSPRERWREIFHRADTGRKARGEPEEGGLRLEPISGIGDEAFWIPNRTGGALYVLRDDVSLRLSVGGKDAPTARLERSKLLARKALEKL